MRVFQSNHARTLERRNEKASRRRAMVRAYFEQGLTDAEIAAQLNTKANTIRSDRQRMGLRRAG